MVFASLTFLAFFLPINLLLYYISNNKTYRNVLLTVLSLVFYAWGEPVWVGLLVFSAFIDYLNGLWVERTRHTKWAKAGVISTLIVNLGLLGAFKYSGFIYENINFIFGLSLKVPQIALPVGISFYSFQTISYVIDVYRDGVKAQRSFLKFLLFVSLFHQLVAGPIVRYIHIADEIDNRRFNWIDISAGIHRFCIGLFKKVAIANVAGEFVKRYLEANLAEISVGEAWFGIIMYSIQIYFDFSGYSDMAIGLGRMFGFHYHENFNYPYIAKSATEFWRRWHISLGTFFRDYVYIPLGGNRKNAYFNLFVVWGLTGFWHGASWNFVLWGLYFGFLIWIEKLFLLKILQKIPAFISHIYLIFLAIVGWALFYFTDFQRLKTFFQIAFGFGKNPLWNYELGFVLKENILWISLAFLLCMPVYMWVGAWFAKKMKYSSQLYPWVFSMAFQFLLLFLSIAMLVGNTYNPFIYYRF
ncbi:MAG: MBOAT family O-acyltransferase [Thermonemataceae bacterium]|nr:MBOAT family O-acyltransferase [Thermonemataceae bacterium]